MRARLLQRSVALLEQLLIQSKSLERRPTIRVVHRLRVESAALSAAGLTFAAREIAACCPATALDKGRRTATPWPDMLALVG